MKLKYTSAFDIIGPVMVGPSSSHTAGAVKIGKIAYSLFPEKIERARITFYGSFAKTYQGHGTALAVVGGLLGFETDDERIAEAIYLAENSGLILEIVICNDEMRYANTVKIELTGANETLELMGASIGGGAVQIEQINGFEIDEQQNCLLVLAGTLPETVHDYLTDLKFIKIQTFQHIGLYLTYTETFLSQDVLLPLSKLESIQIIVTSTGTIQRK